MNKVWLLVFSFIVFTLNGSFAQSRLIWSSSSSQINSQITDARSFAVDRSGNNYSVNYTQSALSLYVSYVFYSHDANGLKLWEYVNDSCLTDCNDKYFNIVPIDNDGAIFVGAFDDITGTQIRIKRIDATGTLIWQQYWITPFLSIQPQQSFLDNNGDLVIGLSATVDSIDLADFAVAKFDTANGFLNWHTELPDAGTGIDKLSETISALTFDANNNIYGVGTGSNSAGTIVKNYFFRLDDTGSLDYRRESSYSGINSNNFSVQVDGSGNLYTMGFTGAEPQIEKRKAQTGNLVWSEPITKDTAVLSNVGFTVIENDVYVTNNYTYFSGSNWDNQHYMLTKLDTSGSFQWNRSYFTDTDSLATQDGFGGAVQFGVCNDNLYFLSSQHLNASNDILILHSTDRTGNTIWYDTASINETTGFFNFDDQCEVYVTRTFDNYNLTQKYTSAPLSTIAAIKDENIFDIYPNPAHDEFSLRFNNEKFGNGVVVIYNSIGEIIKREPVIGNESKISLSGNAQGIYFVQLFTNTNRSLTKVLVKN